MLEEEGTSKQSAVVSVLALDRCMKGGGTHRLIVTRHPHVSCLRKPAQARALREPGHERLRKKTPQKNVQLTGCKNNVGLEHVCFSKLVVWEIPDNEQRSSSVV